MISPRGCADGRHRISLQTASVLCAIAVVAVLLVALLMGLHHAGQGCDDFLGCG